VAQAAAFAAPAAFAPSLLSARLGLQGVMPLRERNSAVLAMNVSPKSVKSHCKKIAASAALSLCLLAGTPMKVSAQATATDYDFEEDLADDEMTLMEGSKEVEIEYTGLRKLTFGEEAIKYGILVGIFGGGVAWSSWEGKKEDREEEERVKAEVERIEKWKAEFIDVDDVVSDDDMLASLQKRMSGEGKEDVEGLDGSGAVPEDYNPDTIVLQDQMKKMEKEQQKKEEQAAKDEDAKFSALQKEVSEESESEDKVAEVDTEQMERLKRMFGGSGEGGDAKGDAKKE